MRVKNLLLVSMCIMLVSGVAFSKDLNQQLIEAVENGDKVAVEELIANGVDVNARDNDSWAALMYAANNGRTEIVKILLTNGAEINMRNEAGRTSLMIAVSSGRLITDSVAIAPDGKWFRAGDVVKPDFTDVSFQGYIDIAPPL